MSIVPSHPQHVCNFQRRPTEERWYGASEDHHHPVGLPDHPSNSSSGDFPDANEPLSYEPFRRNKRPRHYVLNESSLDDLADRHGYAKLLMSLAPVASYRRGACRLVFWLTTGNVGSYLDHPTQGKSLLVRRDIGPTEAERDFPCVG